MTLRCCLLLALACTGGCGGIIQPEEPADASPDGAGIGPGQTDSSHAGAPDATTADASAPERDASSDRPPPPPSCTNPPSRLYAGPGTGFPSGIAVDSSNVYFVEEQTGDVLSVPLCGGAVTTLASDKGAIRTAVNATAVYWTNRSGSVKSVPLGGGATSTIFSTSGEAVGIALDATRVYWTLAGQAGSVMSAPLVGGVPTIIASNQDDPVYLAVTANAAFWIDEDIYGPMDGGCLVTAPLAGGPPVALSPWANLSGAGVTADASNVYWLQGGTIYSMPVAGGPVTALAASRHPLDIAVDATHVYWTDRLANTVMKVPIGGGTPATVATSFDFPMYLAVDSTTVYWTDFSDLVMSAPK